ncbi:hypothetical protein [Curtobacterium sp. 'Ferrero']|uniref:hypothetical protein n=1 Tax=Curtobacterium sp. 'Ferrero' TaxID=2033654 RepID=UPI001144BF24|nr:hypothetical protein [Curtobacterium sp. 'Ferrero']
MERRRLLRVVAVLGSVGLAAVLTGCTHADPVPKPQYGEAWIDRMTGLISDPDGQGGTSGRLEVSDDDPHGAHAAAYLESIASGTYDVVGVCRSTDFVDLTVRSFRSGTDHDDAEHEPVLAAGAITCGATTRLHIVVPRGSGVDLEASTSDRSGRGLWVASIVRPGHGG